MYGQNISTRYNESCKKGRKRQPEEALYEASTSERSKKKPQERKEEQEKTESLDCITKKLNNIKIERFQQDFEKGLENVLRNADTEEERTALRDFQRTIGDMDHEEIISAQEELEKTRVERGILDTSFDTYIKLQKELSQKRLKTQLDLDPSEVYIEGMSPSTSVAFNVIERTMKKRETESDTLLKNATTSKVHHEAEEQQSRY